MRFISIFIISVLSLHSDIFGQTRTITGIVITEHLETYPQVFIQNSDSIILDKTDMDGQFKIEVPIDTKKLIFSQVGLEWKTINLPRNCDHLDIVLMYDGTYDFMSFRKIDRLRKKKFKKLPEIYQLAFKKGLFANEKPCYVNEFVPIRVKRDKAREY